MKKLFFTFVSIIGLITIQLQAQDCSSLFFSEYIEGSNNNKALEIYNPTANPINLNGYFVGRYSNGSQTLVDSLTLTGTIAPYDVFVITNGQLDSQWVSTYWSLPVDSALYQLGDMHDKAYPAVCYFNGDDAVTLENIDGTILDIFGKVGEDPGNGWTNQEVNNFLDIGDYWNIWTKDYSLIRKKTVLKGVSDNPLLFNVTLEYDTLPKDIWTDLGLHICDCKTDGINTPVTPEPEVVVFPHPISGQKFNVRSNKVFTRVEILNSLGQIISSSENLSPRGDISMNMDSDQAGLYFLRVYYPDNQIVIKKIIVR
jgi:hypothetical protein